MVWAPLPLIQSTRASALCPPLSTYYTIYPTHPSIHKFMHVYIIYIQTNKHTYIYTYIHTYTHIHTYIHTHTITHIHTHTYIYKHTHIVIPIYSEKINV